MIPRRGRRTGAAALLLALVASTGCTVSEPGEKGWNEIARTSLTDAAGEVATARLTVAAARDDEVWDAYAVTVTSEVERQVATAEESLASVQPPPGLRERAEQLLTILGDAADAVRAARVAVVAGDIDEALLRQLRDTVSALERAAGRL
ncbi:4-hydroxy-3-methylbut-2-en-1-yl diphosphate synthase IspG/GcpE [Nocardioides thalensis]|uniref:4-hydroxy-3-methylbut-2-en-1-yl diphosphate synthase IspG/GcpE n=1 Tax=Nocardioides thalensis TaxID=1914755 RepID=A0A853BXM0_9ACTN|nr:hypothetical protein [Nocardioides thalensis]NYI99864.1 4-hydroxy-3-methylbut-2-en-1-yl diphosphate synthase IspG/GcpE [Nocardioides thalensis]